MNFLCFKDKNINIRTLEGLDDLRLEARDGIAETQLTALVATPVAVKRRNCEYIHDDESISKQN